MRRVTLRPAARPKGRPFVRDRRVARKGGRPGAGGRPALAQDFRDCQVADVDGASGSGHVCRSPWP